MASYADTDDVDTYEPTIAGATGLEALLEAATLDVDDVLGPLATRTTGDFAGLKLDPTELLPFEAQTLARATCAQAAHRLSTAESNLPAGTKRIKGPDYELELVETAATMTARTYSPRLSTILQRVQHLRGLGARLR